MTSGARVGVGLAVLAVLGALGACSSSKPSSTTASTTGTTASSPTSAPPASHAPNASFTLTGAVGLGGPVAEEGTRCSLPDLDGLTIAVLGVPTDGTSLARIALRHRRVKVIVSTGTGAGFHERSFEGTGVTGFDAARRGVVDSKLTETAAPPGSTKGKIGTITAIKGTVDCGDQTPGSSTIKITGTTPEGKPLTAAMLDPVRVECDPSPQGPELAASGLVSLGGNRVLVTIGLTSDGAVTVDEILPAVSHRYTAGGDASITARGAQVRADVVMQNVAAPPRLHVEGNLVCGRNAAG